MGRSFLTAGILPAECDLHRVVARGLVDEMGFGAKIFFAAIVSETDLHRANVGLRYVCGAVAKALRPEVARLIAHSRDAPIFDKRLPSGSMIGGELDLVFRLRRRRVP